MAATAAAPGGAGGGTAASSARASRFAAACGALSQYVKLKGAAERAVRRPLPLMPGADVDAAVPDCQDEEAGPAPAQLTIVYGGRALVLDDVPADKAADLLRLAAAAAAQGGTTAPAATAAADMPVARKASLQRFMEKRKGRIAARAEPYPRPSARDGGDHLALTL